jgi:hypothetical protein
MPDAAPIQDQTLAEDASYRWGYLVIAYGLLAIVGYRGFILQETSWELLALVVGGGVVTSLHRASQGESTGWWRVTAGVTAVVALALAAWLASLVR